MAILHPFRALALTLAAAFAGLAHAQPVLEAIAGSVGGKGGVGGACGSLGAPAEMGFFTFSLPVVDLAGIASCGYSGSITTVTNPVGPVVNSASLTPVGVDFGDPTIKFDGTASALASYGSLGATAHAHLVGQTANGVALFSSLGIATFRDQITAVSGLVPSGSGGFVRYQFHIDGALAALGAAAPFFFGDTFAALSVQQGTGPNIGVFNATVRRGSLGTISGNPPPAGWVNASGSLSGGSDFLTFELPMTWGAAFDFKVGLLAWAYGTSDTQFGTTARLTGIDLFDANQDAVTNFVLSSASGSDYLNFATTTPVPEPSSVALMLIGLVLVGSRATGLGRAFRRAGDRCPEKRAYAA
jgi:hypothetical protein